jgi:hypothetical protein
MNIITRQVCQIEEDYNNRELAKIFYEKTGINWQYELDDQEIGTDCSKIIEFNSSNYPTSEQLEGIIYNKEELYVVPIVNYLRRIKVLPEMDFLFNVSY